MIGTVQSAVSFSLEGAPAFATLEGSLVTLAPQRADQGDYTFSIRATAGSQSQAATVTVSVNRFNTAPRFPNQIGLSDDTGWRYSGFCPSPAFCTTLGTPVLLIGFCDDEGDGVTVDAEVVERGHPFAKKPTHSIKAPARVLGPERAGTCGGVELPLAALPAGRSYDFALRITDEFGAVAAVPATAPATDDGWSADPRFGFDQGPCADGQCACAMSGMGYCFRGSDCCSGACKYYGQEQFGACEPCTAEQHCACMPTGHGPCVVNSDCCSGNCWNDGSSSSCR